MERRQGIIRSIVWVLVFLTGFLFLYLVHRFHFLYVEQEHLFLRDWRYILEKLLSFRGLSKLSSEFLIQYWKIPAIGPLTVAALATLTGYFLWRFLRRVFPGKDLMVLSLAPVAALIFLSYKDGFDLSLLVTFCLLAAVLWLVSSLLNKESGSRNDREKNGWISSIVQLAIVVVVGLFSYQASAKQSDTFKELDWYMYQDRPDDIIRVCSKTGVGSYVYQNFLNWALAKKGLLADEMFNYSQTDPYSLILEWREIAYTSVLMSNIYYDMGHIALSQRMAFEANVIYDNSNPRMLQRLIQTNLIFGQYDVAEKYISRLEKTRFYSRWAAEKRRFLRDRKAIMDDPELGGKARCIPTENSLSLSKGDLAMDLEDILRANPDSETTLQYAGAHLLLAKNTLGFKEFLEEFMTGKKLPKSFKEAVMILSESDKALVERWNIDSETARRYEEFKRFYSENSRRKDLKRRLTDKYGDTYWLYFLYFKTK